MTVYNDLIVLFAKHAVSEIEGDNGRILKKRFGVATVEELAKIEGYKDNFALVRECKVELETVVAQNATSAARQVTECLERLHLDKQHDRARRTDAFCDLIRRSVYATAWTAHERKTFDDKYEVIMDWRHYFLSYTNRDAAVTNKTFRKLIKFAYSPPASEWQKKNLVARIVAKLLTQNNAIGFFDHEKIKSGDEIENDILAHCRKCWAFVQIVEPETLKTPPAGTINWCFEEYNEFDSTINRLQALAGHDFVKRYHFVITLDPFARLKPVFANPNYDLWTTRAEKLHCKVLEEKSYEEVREAVREIASGVAELRKAVIAELLQ